jgi:hypothetical protein
VKAVRVAWHPRLVQPTVRAEVHDTYWWFAFERLQILERRIDGESAPWTEDQIFRRFKFCNTFRVADRVSQYLIRNVIYSAAAEDLAPEDVFLRIVLFRLFSKETTWDLIDDASGGLQRSTFDVELIGNLLEAQRQHRPIYTAAFILAAPSVYGFRAKHRNHLALVADMFRPGRLGVRLARAGSLRDVFEALLEYPMIGPFLGYQIAIDLNYSEHINFDENDFTVPGPGALRGLEKVFIDKGGLTPQQLIMRMVDRQDEEFQRLGLDFGGLFGRPLHAIDCQGLFCETDKYSREAFPNLKSSRVRIKQEYRHNERALDDLFFPPKWPTDYTKPTGPTHTHSEPACQARSESIQVSAARGATAPGSTLRAGRAAVSAPTDR